MAVTAIKVDPQETRASNRLALPIFSSALFWISLLACVLFFHQLGRRDLTSSHEARAAQNAQRMLDDDSFGLPTLFDGQTDLQKPPGFYWLVALFSEANDGHVSPFTTRLPAALGGLITVLAVFVFLKRDGRTIAAIVAAVALATAAHFTGMARTARIDMPLTAAVCVVLVAFYLALESQGRSRIAWQLLAMFGICLAVLLKGPIGIALVGMTGFVFSLVERRFGMFLSMIWPMILGIALASPWFLWANHVTEGEFVRVFVWHHNVARFMGTSPTLASHPWWYYAPRFAVDFLPWSPLFGGLAVWGFATGLWRRDSLFRFGMVWFAVTAIVLSASHFKRSDYLLPAYPGAAIALGCAAEAWSQLRTRARSRQIAKLAFAATASAVLVGWQVMIYAIEPRLAAKEEKQPFAERIRREAPAPNLVLMFRVESHLLSFHLGRPLHTLVEWGELNERLKAPGRHYIVTQPIYAEEAVGIVTSRKMEVIARLEDFTSDTPARPLVFLCTVE